MRQISKSVMGCLVLFFLFQTASALAAGNSPLVRQKIMAFFQQEFKIPQQDILLDFVHVPELEIPSGQNTQLRVVSQTNLRKLGYRTLWIEIYAGTVLKEKHAASVNVAIEHDVWVSARKIDRHCRITPDMVRVERRRIDRDWGELIPPGRSVTGLEANRVIPAGVPLTGRLVETAPDIRRGAKVEVQIIAGGLVVSAPGIARKSGAVGDKINVMCEVSRKEMWGTIKSSHIVVVHQ